MDGEFNNLNINNTNITFSVATNNIATSDELNVDPIYQRQMGTNYSKGKKVGRAITIVGISLAFTATAIAGGSVLSNIFVPNPPTVSNALINVEGETLTYSFTLKNVQKYKTVFYLDINGENVIKEEIVESNDYEGEYSPVVSGDRCKAYIVFTNSLDYYKTIYTNEFIAK